MPNQYRAIVLVIEINSDKAETLQSRLRLEALALKENACVIIQYEKADIESLPKFPLYLN